MVRFFQFKVKIWFQNHRYKCKRQAKEKAMAEQNQHNQVRKLDCAHWNRILFFFMLKLIRNFFSVIIVVATIQKLIPLNRKIIIKKRSEQNRE